MKAYSKLCSMWYQSTPFPPKLYGGWISFIFCHWNLPLQRWRLRPSMCHTPHRKTKKNPDSNQSDTSVQTSLDQNQGYLNPYFLHHNDNTNLVLVTEQLIEENYVSLGVEQWPLDSLWIIRLVSLMELSHDQPEISFQLGSEITTCW